MRRTTNQVHTSVKLRHTWTHHHILSDIRFSRLIFRAYSKRVDALCTAVSMCSTRVSTTRRYVKSAVCATGTSGEKHPTAHQLLVHEESMQNVATNTFGCGELLCYCVRYYGVVWSDGLGPAFFCFFLHPFLIMFALLNTYFTYSLPKRNAEGMVR